MRRPGITLPIILLLIAVPALPVVASTGSCLQDDGEKAACCCAPDAQGAQGAMPCCEMGSEPAPLPDVAMTGSGSARTPGPDSAGEAFSTPQVPVPQDAKIVAAGGVAAARADAPPGLYADNCAWLI